MYEFIFSENNIHGLSTDYNYACFPQTSKLQKSRTFEYSKLLKGRTNEVELKSCSLINKEGKKNNKNRPTNKEEDE